MIYLNCTKSTDFEEDFHMLEYYKFSVNDLDQPCLLYTSLEQKCQEYKDQLLQTQQPILPNQIPPVPTNGFTQGIDVYKRQA